MIREMGRQERGMLVLAAMALALALGLEGCSMKDREVTERDVEVALQMGAPDDIVASMERGVWPSDLARWKVRNAEACIDYLSELYGLEFSAVSATGGPKWMTCYDDVYLRIESGPHAGEEVRLAYDSGMRGGRQEREPAFNEDCYYVVNHEGWERIAEEAIAPILAELPEGAFEVSISMSKQLYPESLIADPVSQGGGSGEVGVVIALDRCGLSESEAGELFEDLYEALHRASLGGRCYLDGYADTSSITDFSRQAIEAANLQYSTHSSRWFGPEERR